MGRRRLRRHARELGDPDNVLAEDVAFDIHEIPLSARLQVRVLPRIRNDLHVEVPIVDPATVRLMPFTVIDPLRTMYGASSGGKLDREPGRSPSGRMSSMVPVASTCPWTKWPPRRASARSGRSRLTSARGEATRARSRAAFPERCRRGCPIASDETAVRQTPLTARLSPATRSGAIAVVTRSRKPAGVGCDLLDFSDRLNQPREHMLRPAYRPKPAGDDCPQARQRKREPLEALRSQPAWRHIGLDAINQPRVPERPMERDAPLDNDGRNPARRQLLEGAAQPRLPRHRQNLRAGASQRGGSFGRGLENCTRTDNYDRPCAERREQFRRRGVRRRVSNTSAHQRPEAKCPRAVSRGSSASTVPDPTAMASTSARSRWISRLAAAPVSGVRRPGPSAMR